jgi:tyrosyl-tRNA synthetase
VQVLTPDFTALVGDPSGDAHGEPVLRVTAR